MKPFMNKSLNFQEAYQIGEQLWAFGKNVDENLRHTNRQNWILTYRYPIRAMLARILTVDRNYQELNKPGCGIAPPEQMASQIDRDTWNVIWESYAGVLFFAMDSSLECFTYALNALGYLLSPREFIDITNEKKLKQITPANLLDPKTKDNASRSVNEACLKWFPKICQHWTANRSFLTLVIEYHDATKHRHSAVVGQGENFHTLKPEPKREMGAIVFKDAGEPGSHASLVPYDEENTLQSITTEYQIFMTEWLRIAQQEVKSVFK